ncbi:MAG TPA: DNA cytosine methyltransferase, partial [Ramlibacter sp.]|nr:DNA cytosine methyltransferase [Ramlibacter sp.]
MTPAGTGTNDWFQSIDTPLPSRLWRRVGGGTVKKRGRMAERKINVLSFFSGAMGLDIGLEQAGMHVVSCCENDSITKNTIRANRAQVVLFDDINDLSAKKILQDTNMSAADIFLVAG